MFDEFKAFVGKTNPPNRFWRLTETDVEAGELRLGHAIPSELRLFFLEVGYGFYAQGTDDSEPTHVNRVLSPKSISNLILDPNNRMRPPEGFPEGVLPFFDIGEFSYLVIRTTESPPNRVYAPGGRKVVADSITSFFTELYRKASFFLERF